MTKAVKIETCVINMLDYDDEDTCPECTGNDTMSWFHVKFADQDDPFDQWVLSQVPEGIDQVLLEWSW